MPHHASANWCGASRWRATFRLSGTMGWTTLWSTFSLCGPTYGASPTSRHSPLLCGIPFLPFHPQSLPSKSAHTSSTPIFSEFSSSLAATWRNSRSQPKTTSSLILTVGCDADADDPKPPFRRFATKWHMLQLTRLPLVYPPEIGNVPVAAFLADCKHILVPHGRKLEYPAFPSATWESRVPVDLGPLLSLCPAMTHLVLPSFAAFHPACTFLLVKWLDSWAEFIHGELPTAPALPAVFPSLEG
ncbi:hypothetical protein DFH08DRAFT_1082951, partial [Mycena albidolilacea]